jgi:flagellar protein FlaF
LVEENPVNVSALAQSAYKPTAAGVQSPREIEYKVFARVSGRIQNALNQKNFPALAAALVDNVDLWMTLARDVGQPGNDLPQDLRKNLAELAIFTARHTKRVLDGDASAITLIEINQAVMKGLRGVKEPAA